MMFVFAIILSSCSKAVVSTVTPVPTIEEQPLVAIDIPITTLLRNPYSFEGEYVRISGLYKPLPLMACNNDPHNSPATWILSDGGIELPAAGFDTVLREIGASDIPLVVEGRWQFWEGPVGCGRRAPKEEIWHLEASRIVSPNPLSQIVESEQEIAILPESTTSPAIMPTASTDMIPIASATSLIALPPTSSPTPESSPTPVATATPIMTGTSQATSTVSASATRTPTPGATETEQVTPTPSVTGSPTEAPASPSATTPPTTEPTATQIVSTGGGLLDFEQIVRSELAANGIHIWEFESLENDIISISVGPAAGLDVALELSDPSGMTIAVINDGGAGSGESINELNLTTGGDYLIEVRAVGGTSGDYSIVLTNMDSEAYLVFKEYLTYGGLGTGNLPESTDHLWNFEAASGDVVSIRLDPANNDDLVLFLIAPDSTEIIFVDDTGLGESEQITDFVITESGTYSIRVGELEFQPASYTLTLNGA